MNGRTNLISTKQTNLRWCSHINKNKDMVQLNNTVISIANIEG